MFHLGSVQGEQLSSNQELLWRVQASLTAYLSALLLLSFQVQTVRRHAVQQCRGSPLHSHMRKCLNAVELWAMHHVQDFCFSTSFFNTFVVVH